jgi:catechol 2,3-dioxygenase-like lactoylglutathione lyase family enzyme
MNMLLEVVTMPVSDIDKAKDFYANKLGFAVDFDMRVSEAVRFVQLTPPGSSCSIHFMTDSSVMKPGVVKSVILVVDNAEDAKAELEAKGVSLSDVEQFDWGKHVYFSDPDGNSWTLQESYARAKRQAEK